MLFRRVEDWEQELEEELREAVEDKVRELGGNTLWNLVEDSKTIDNAISNIVHQLRFLKNSGSNMVREQEMHEEMFEEGEELAEAYKETAEERKETAEEWKHVSKEATEKIDDEIDPREFEIFFDDNLIYSRNTSSFVDRLVDYLNLDVKKSEAQSSAFQVLNNMKADFAGNNYIVLSEGDWEEKSDE